ncbi:MAG: US12 family protein [Clostridia bacterium]|nr:US12 family protein [Clostridia bacterium]
MTFGNTKAALEERKAYKENDIAVSRRVYNLLIGGLLLWGFALNFLMVKLLGEKVSEFAMNGGALPILLIYLVCVILGAVLVRRDNPVTSFIGYNLIALPVGLILCVALQGYPSSVISTAVLMTAIITAVFVVLGSIFPNLFLSIGRALGVGLIILIVGELITLLLFRSSRMELVWAYLGAGLFAMFIGFDWARCNVCACTVNNAIAASANLYLDIINLFLRLLQILNKNRK